MWGWWGPADWGWIKVIWVAVVKGVTDLWDQPHHSWASSCVFC